jgi:hypothetical protein
MTEENTTTESVVENVSKPVVQATSEQTKTPESVDQTPSREKNESVEEKEE